MALLLPIAESVHCSFLTPLHKGRRAQLWSNIQCKSVAMKSGPAATLQRGVEGKQEQIPLFSSRAGDELQGLCEEGRLDKALALLSVMDQQGVVPSTNVYMALLKACTKRKALAQARLVHARVASHGLERTRGIGESVVRMFVSCGALEDAIQILHGLPERSASSWTAVIVGYASAGKCQGALRLYQLMRNEGLEPNRDTLVSLLKACGRTSNLVKGRYIHSEVVDFGFESDLFVGMCLIEMYGKCGSIVDAHAVFDRLSQRDVVSWTAILGTYVHQGKAEKALDLYEEMQEEGVSPDVRTFVTALRACGKVAELEQDVVVDGWSIKARSLEKGKAIHAHSWRKGCESNVFLSSTLVSMYGKCGSIVDAENVFQGLSQRDVVSWNAMLAAYAQHGNRAEQGLLLYEEMLENGVTVDDRAFVCALQACATLGEKEQDAAEHGLIMNVKLFEKGKVIHCEAWRRGYRLDVFVGSTLVSMYSKCGSIADAQNVFDGLLCRDVVVWNVMLAAYIQQDQAERALELYGEMLEELESPDNRTVVSALQACGMKAEQEDDFVLDGHSVKLNALELAKSIHGFSCGKGFDLNVFIGNTLVSIYGKCGSFVDAQNVFDELSERDVVSWNALLAASAQQGQAEKALQLYARMQEEVNRDDRTFVTMLQACGMLAEKGEDVVVFGRFTRVNALEVGKEIHADACNIGCETDVFVANTLISMYAKCGSTSDAWNVFNGACERNMVSWTAMLTAYAHQGQAKEALQLYEQMLDTGWSPDSRVIVSVLQACGLLAEKEECTVVDGQLTKARVLVKGKAIHADAWKRGYKSDPLVCNALMSMYGKCGSIRDAQDAFDGFADRDAISWNAILAAYADHGQPERCLQLYKQMQEEGISSNEATHVSLLQVCSNAGKVDVCREMHSHFVSTGNDLTPRLASILIHAYGRCGSMSEAQKVFDTLPQHEVVSWTALIAGYARQGNWQATVHSYEKMQLECVEPNAVTFLSLLSACSHAGLVDKGVEYFESMSKDHHISPEIEHYTSLIDLLGRAGYFQSVEDLLSKMPVQPNSAMWLCLLSSCRKHGNVVLAKRAYDCTLQLEPKHPSAYVLMSNIYANAGLWDCANKVHELRQEAGAWKLPGQTWIDDQKETHKFVVAEHEHQQQHHIYELLGRLNLELVPLQ